MQVSVLSRFRPIHLLMIGTAVRLLLAPFTAMPLDVQIWYRMSMQTPAEALHGFPVPIWPLILCGLNAIGQALSLDMSLIPVSTLPHEIDLSAQHVELVTSLSFNLLVKFPLILSDLALTFLIYKVLAREGDRTTSMRTAIVLWYLNPFSIGISSVWGMFDTLAALFVMLALYLFTSRTSRHKLGITALWASVATKLYALALLPATALYLHAKKRSTALCVLIISIVIAIVISLTFFQYPFGFFTRWLLTSLFVLPHDPGPSFGMGLSYWTILLVTPVSATAQILILDMVTVLLTVTVLYQLTKLTFHDSLVDLAAAYASSILVIYLSIRGVPAQFFIWSLPLLAILVARGRLERRLFWLSSGIGTLFLLSMFHIFLYPLAAYYPDQLAWLYSSLAPVRTMTAGQARPLPGIRPGTAILWLLGTSFSATMLLTLVEALFKPGTHIIDSALMKLHLLTPDGRPSAFSES